MGARVLVPSARAVVLFALGCVLAVGLSGCQSYPRSDAQTPPSNSETTETAWTDATGRYDSIPDKTRSAVTSLAPVIRLHSEEQYFPCSIDYFLQNSVLRSKTATLSAQPTTRTIAAATASAAVAYPRLEATSIKSGQASSSPNYKKWPTYVALKSVTVTDQANEFLIIEYNTFYAYNTVSTTGDWGKRYGDHHWGDWERVSVVAERAKGTDDDWKFKAIMTRFHTAPIKVTKAPETYEKTYKKVYSARYSHGTHNSWTDLGDADTWGDIRDDKGVAWNLAKSPKEIIAYREYRFTSKDDFATSEALDALDASTYVDELYRKKWTKFAGPWGASIDSSPTNMVDYEFGIKVPYSGNSPHSRYLGAGKAELVALSGLL